VVGRKRQPVEVIGGIAPDRAYSLPEFRAITGLTRQALSRARKRDFHPLMIRDGETPTVLGKDWIEFLEASPPHQARTRRPPRQPRTPD